MCFFVEKWHYWGTIQRNVSGSEAMIVSKKGEFFVFTLFAIFSIILSGIEHSWAGAVGFNMVPLLVSYFIIRGAVSSRRFFASSIIVVFIFVALNAGAIKTAYDVSHATVFEDCYVRNSAVAQMPTEVEKKQFCSCFSDDVTMFAMRQDAMDYFGLIDPDEVKQSQAVVSFLTEAFAQCHAKI